MGKTNRKRDYRVGKEKMNKHVKEKTRQQRRQSDKVRVFTDNTYGAIVQPLTHWTVTPEIAGSNPVGPAIWESCKGSTTGFGPVHVGSNPSHPRGWIATN